MCLITALLGLTGTMLNSRPILAFYNLLLWPTLAVLLLVGYTSYKKQALNLDRKLNQAWSQFFDDNARLRIQNNVSMNLPIQVLDTTNALLYSSIVVDIMILYVRFSMLFSVWCLLILVQRTDEATFSKRCYPRTSLPGCKGKLFRVEKKMLEEIAAYAFLVVPVHLFNICIGLLCSNHVNRTFGKGLMPRTYRLRWVFEKLIWVLDGSLDKGCPAVCWMSERMQFSH